MIDILTGRLSNDKFTKSWGGAGEQIVPTQIQNTKPNQNLLQNSS